MENIEYSNSLYQLSEILKYMEPKLKARIPKKLFAYFENNKSTDYNWSIDKTLPLEKQELVPATKEILTVLYKEYLCDDAERLKVEKTLNDNELKYQNELREKYNPDNLFKNTKKEVENITAESEMTSVLTYKESFFKKILDKIKLFFHR